nr:copia protein [Tanacetum cinerariifolium]
KPEFEGEKLESEVHVSPSSSAQTKKLKDKTKREAKVKIPVESSTKYRNLSAEFEDFSDNSINEVNTADDLNMPELEDITYSDDKEDVGAEADFTNLETTITVSSIATTRVHKDHPVTQIIVDLPNEKRAIGTKWVFRNKKDERGIVVRNKAQLVAEGHTQEECIDYEEVFAPVSRIESIRLFLAYAPFMGFMMYQMDVKSAFLYGTIKEELCVCQPPGFKDPNYPDNIYKVVKALYGLHQAPRACQDKYVAEILRKFGLTDGKSASTPIDTEKPLLKDPNSEDVDVHTYILIIGSLILISWQCKKQTVIATSSTEAEYVATASCCVQVLWIQNQLMDYSPDQTVSGKDSSNPLMADNLPKIVSYLTHHVALIKNWLVQKQMALGVASVVVDDVFAAADEPSIPSPTPTTQPPPPSQDLPSTSQDKIAQTLEITKLKQKVKKLERSNKLKVFKLRRLKKVRTAQRVNTSEDTIMDDEVVVEKDAEIEKSTDVQGRQAESQAQIYQIDLEHADKVLSMQDDEIEPAELKEEVECAARRRKRVVIRDPKETATPSIIIHSKPKSKDKGKGIMVEEPKPLKKQAQIEQDEAYAREYQALKRKPQTKAQARKNMMIYLRNMAGFKMNYFKGMSYDDIHPIFEKNFNSNVAFLVKTKEQMEEQDSKALKRTSKSQADKARKKQKLDEEVTKLKKHLQIVPSDDDDVYTEATPLARKVLVVDYEIYTENNKPYYKIIRADGSSQPFLSFLSLLRNFNREDWSFFIISSIAVQTPGSVISNLLAVGTTFTGSGNLYCQWEVSPGSGNALCILFPTDDAAELMLLEQSAADGNMSYLTDYEKIDGGYVAFGGNPKGGKFTGRASKDKTSGILKKFIIGIENLVDHKVKVIKCDNGTEFKNREMNQFCEMKGIMRQYSVARPPQQNSVAERRNKTLIEVARTMLADSKLPTNFWAEAVNTACYVQNRVLVVKPHNKTPYELFHGRTPTLSFIRPFGYYVTILNTKDHLGKFNGNQSNRSAGTKACDDADFVMYLMDVKSAFLYGKIKEEVYVCQPPVFEDQDFPDKVYKVEKALYGLHQAPRAWYLKGHIKLGLWYPKDSPFDLVAYIDSDYARASLDRKSTIGGCQYLGCRLISWQCKKQTMVANFTTKADMVKNLDNVNKFLMYPRVGKDFSRRVTPLFLIMIIQAQEEMGEDSAHPTDPHFTPTIIQPLTSQSLKKQKSRKTKRKDTELPQTSVPTSVAYEVVNVEMDDSLEMAATTATSLDPEHDRGVSTPRSGEDSLKLNELMELCINLQNMVLNLETTKTTQAIKIESLKRRVKKLEKRQSSKTHKLKRLYKVGLSTRVESFKDEGLGEKDSSNQGRIIDIDADDDITLVSTHDEQMFMLIKIYMVTIAATTPIILVNEATLAKVLAELKHAKSKTKLDEEVALKLREELQAEFEKEQRLADYKVELVEGSSKKAKVKVIEGSSKRARTELEHESSKKEDVKTLQKLVKAKYGSTRPEEHYERVLWGDLKVMFEPHINDEVWKMQQRYKVTYYFLRYGKFSHHYGITWEKDVALPPRDQRNQYLRFEGLQYTDDDIMDFEMRLGKIYRREVHRVQVFDFKGLTDLIDEGLSGKMLMEHEDAQGKVEEMETAWFGLYWAESGRQIFDKRDLSAYWREISSEGDFLGTPPSYTLIRDLMLRLCHRLIACSIAGRSQALEKVTITDLFYLKMMDVGSVNIPCTLATTCYPRTMPKRIAMLEEEVQELRWSIMGLRGDAFYETLVGSSWFPYQRHTRRRTNDASTSTAQQDE